MYTVQTETFKKEVKTLAEARAIARKYCGGRLGNVSKWTASQDGVSVFDALFIAPSKKAALDGVVDVTIVNEKTRQSTVGEF
jgi:hypothetical protein